jgi:uncharacterized protein YecT (DUF1311 family)
MRNLIRLAAAALVISCAAPVWAEDANPSAAVCDAKRLGARELAECLRAASDKFDKELTEEVAMAVKSIDTRAGLMSGQKSRWKRSLNDAESQWLAWRDSECQDVAPFEAGMSAKAGDPRLACLIDQDERRIADLRARYP